MTLKEADGLQEALAGPLLLTPLAWPPRVVGAVDAAYAEGGGRRREGCLSDAYMLSVGSC